MAGNKDHRRMSQPIIFQSIIAPLLPLLKEESCKLNGDRIYRLNLYVFTLNLCYCVIKGIGSISLLITEIKTSVDTKALDLVHASKSMYSEAFARYDPIIFKRIFLQLVKTLEFLPIPEMNALGRFILIDGSIFPAIKTVEWAKYKTQANGLKLHLSYNLNKMIPTLFVVTDANTSEKKILASMLEPGITYIADRGYVAFKLFHQITKQCAFFIIRVKPNMHYSATDFLEVELPEKWGNVLSNITDSLIVFDNDTNKGAYRLIGFTALGEVYWIATNRLDLKTHEIIMLYAYRWQIELFFRCLKRTLNGLHLWTHDQRGVEIQFYIYLIVYLLLISFKQNNTEKEQAIDEIDVIEKEGTATCNQANAREQVSRTPACGMVTLLGEKLEQLWKMSIHWLTAVRNRLLEPMTPENRELINSC